MIPYITEKHKTSRCSCSLILAAMFALLVICVSSTPARAQALGWEGETGVFVTPMAYTASAEGQKIHPVVAYHYFNAGSVIGDFHESSIELGIGKRFEVGYTHSFHVDSGDPAGYLWQSGYDIFNGKAIVVPENYKKQNWVPAISVGFIARTGVKNVGNFFSNGGTTDEGGSLVGGPTKSGNSNGDIYLVGTKVLPVKHGGALSAFVLNAGVRGTNAQLWGMGGNAPDWSAQPFGALAIVFKGPAKSTIIFGSEAAHQPHHPGIPDVGALAINIPTTLTYCARVVPSPKAKLNFDFGVAQVAGQVNPTTNLKARHTVGFQMSYGF